MRRGFPLPWGRLVDLRGGEALSPTLVLMQGCAVASPVGLLYLTLSRRLQYEAFGVSTASLAYPQSVPAIAPCVPPLRVFLRHLYVECIEPWPYIRRLVCVGDEMAK